MTTNWITSHLPIIQIDGIGTEVVLITHENGSFQSIDPDTLAQMTSGVNDPPTHTQLSALPIANQGWQPIFDDWLAKGIITS